MVCTCRSPATQTPVAAWCPAGCECLAAGWADGTPAAAGTAAAVEQARATATIRWRGTLRNSLRSEGFLCAWRMTRPVRRLLGIVAAAAVVTPATVALATPARPPHNPTVRQGVAATVTATGASLSNGVLARTWSFGPGGSVQTTALTGPGSGSIASTGADFT